MTDAPASKDAPAEPPLPPVLAPARAAFDRGNYRQARALVASALASDPSPEVAGAARTMMAAIENDPWAIRFALIAAGILALVIGAYVF